MLLPRLPGSWLGSQEATVTPRLRDDATDTRIRWPNAGLMLAHRLRRWASIKQALDQRM